MGCPIFLAVCFKNVSWVKVVKALAILISVVTSLFMFLNHSEFTRWSTALIVSLCLGAIITLGILFSAYLRCAAILFFIMCLSKVGLLQIFIAFSWFILQHGISIFLKNHKLMQDVIPKISNSTEEDFTDVETTFLQGLLGTMHYTVLVPFGLIYVYALLYEITYVAKQLEKRTKRSGFDPAKAAMRVLKFVSAFIAGMLFCAVLLILVLNRITYLNLSKSLRAIKEPVDYLQEMSIGWLWSYLISCAAFLILLGFSKFVNKCRYHVILTHFQILQGTLNARSSHVFTAKPKTKRMTRKEFLAKKMEKKKTQKAQEEQNKQNAKENIKSANDDQPTSSKASLKANQDETSHVNTVKAAIHFEGEFSDSDVSYSSESDSSHGNSSRGDAKPAEGKKSSEGSKLSDSSDDSASSNSSNFADASDGSPKKFP